MRGRTPTLKRLPPAPTAPTTKVARPAAPPFIPHAYHHSAHATTAEHVLAACQHLCNNEPRVKGKKAGQAAKASGKLIDSLTADSILRRLEMCKLIALLPEPAICQLSGLTLQSFQLREPTFIASYIFGKANAVSADTIRKGRHSLTRLLTYMTRHEMVFEENFGCLPEVDLYGFLLDVHLQAVTNGSDKRPGFSAVWGVFDGLTYLKRHFKFPFLTDEVRNALQQRGRRTGAAAILDGALPLPPEALDLLCAYASREDTPPVLGSYAYALAISTLGSMRQMNTQHIYYYGEISIGVKQFLLVQYADGKSRGKKPTLALIPLQDMQGSRAWFDRNKGTLWQDDDFLWAESDGDPRSHHSRLLPCPLESGKIQGANRLILQEACGMSPVMTASFTKHSARKTMVSVAQAAGCPWEQCLELGHWADCSLDSAFLLPDEVIRRKRALVIMQLPKRYSANARLTRVARILGNQVDRMREYLNHPGVRNRHPHDWAPKWHLISQYNLKMEGA